MLLEFLEKPVMIDRKPVMQNFRLNLEHARRGLRMKAEFIDPNGGRPVPVDIAVYKYSDVGLERLSLAISLNGEEMLRKLKFDLKLSFDFFKRRWKLKGTFGQMPINREMDSIAQIFIVIQELAISTNTPIF